MREFKTGATRDNDDMKLDYEGFLSPIVLEVYAEYLNHHRVQRDGKLRASDNWQKGIPITAYMKSMLRHVMEAWRAHRGFDADVSIKDSLCAIIFNAFGYLYELERGIPVIDAVDIEKMSEGAYNQ